MTISAFLDKVSDLILNPLILLVFALSFVYFIYGIVKFISLEDGDKAKVDARTAILWGMFGMIVMFSVYGLIKFVLATFGIDTNDSSLVNTKQYIGL